MLLTVYYLRKQEVRRTVKNKKEPKTLDTQKFQLSYNYSHSIVDGGLLVMSYTTRLTSSISSTIRDEIFSSTSSGILAQFDVTPSTDVTARIPIVWTYVRSPSFTPTLRILGKTVKYCQTSRSSPAFAISSRKMASDSRTISSFSSVTSPRTRIASPGPGKG